MAAVELRSREEIERGGEESDPGGAADGMEKEIGDGRVRIEDRRERVKDQRRAEDGADMRRVGEVGNELCVQDAEDQRGYGDDEADERAGRADVEQRALGSNRRANQDESAEACRSTLEME